MSSPLPALPVKMRKDISYRFQVLTTVKKMRWLLREESDYKNRSDYKLAIRGF
jgi:hypothetical protein